MGRVLIVDDAMFMRQSLAMLVKELGHEVVGMGGNGKEAIRLYSELYPYIVTKDITMPEMNELLANCFLCFVMKLEMLILKQLYKISWLS